MSGSIRDHDCYVIPVVVDDRRLLRHCTESTDLQSAKMMPQASGLGVSHVKQTIDIFITIIYQAWPGLFCEGPKDQVDLDFLENVP